MAGFTTEEYVNKVRDDLIRRISVGGNGDIKADGSVAFTGEQSFQAGLRTDDISFTTDLTITSGSGGQAAIGLTADQMVITAQRIEMGVISGNPQTTAVMVLDPDAGFLSLEAYRINMNLAEFPDNGAAITSGLSQGDLYKTGGAVMIVI